MRTTVTKGASTFIFFMLAVDPMQAGNLEMLTFEVDNPNYKIAYQGRIDKIGEDYQVVKDLATFAQTTGPNKGAQYITIFTLKPCN